MILDAAAFDAEFDSFGESVVRLEQLPAYSVGGAEAERIAAWRRGEPRPERSVRTSKWLARIATSTVAGKSWMRVRVVDEPLTEYQRYQLDSYRESQAVGEQVLLVPRSLAYRGYSGPDFWLFDAGTAWARAVLMHYHPDGRLDRRELAVNHALMADLADVVRRDAAQAVSLNQFLATMRHG